MDRWTFTFVAILVASIAMTGFANSSGSAPQTAELDPAKTAWPALTKINPVTP